MPKDDGYSRYLEFGTAFLNMTQQRAEALVKELVRSGEVQKKRAQVAIDDLMERGRRSTDDLRTLIKREISEQLTALGLATKDDVARLEAKLDASLAARSREEQARAPQQTAPRRSTTKGAPITKAATAKMPSPAAKTAPVTKTAAPQKSAGPAKGPTRQPRPPGPDSP